MWMGVPGSDLGARVTVYAFGAALRVAMERWAATAGGDPAGTCDPARSGGDVAELARSAEETVRLLAVRVCAEPELLAEPVPVPAHRRGEAPGEVRPGTAPPTAPAGCGLP
ncbi:hypothetical protein [Plantactinospora sp. CA-290183]|uniref:hypothetical protein n=1 Tax=Plantactinospora sp. CA-290183 TaxID=3240006 RepID=UPI003D8B4399